MRSRTLASAAMAVALPIVLSNVMVVEAAGKCFLGGHLYNKDRKISEGGVIEAEVSRFDSQSANGKLGRGLPLRGAHEREPVRRLVPPW